MKTTTFFVSSILSMICLLCFSLNYTITFTGTGASTTVDSVIVQNLTKRTSATVPGGNVLHLTDQAAAVEQVGAPDESIRVYPASVAGKFIVSFFAKQAGVTQLNAYSIDGRMKAEINANLPAGNNTFEFSLPQGVYMVRGTGDEFSYTVKLINKIGTQSKPEIAYAGTEKPAFISPQKSKNSILGETDMTYAAGDQLLYKAISGNYSTIVTDVPTASKTTNFHFVFCTDADGNNYTTVNIGNQTWMAENLKTTTFNDNTAIPLVTGSYEMSKLLTPAYCWFNNKYGALYNWYTVNTAKLAPVGWHVPTDTEWTTLTDYIASHVGTSLNVAKALAATTDWMTSTISGAIGNNLTQNNSMGFSALPGGGNSLNVSGTAFNYGSDGVWWSATSYSTTSARFRQMYYIYDYVGSSYYSKPACLSVR